MKNKVLITYNPNGYITFQRGSLEISAILFGYDDVKRLLDFEDGLLTVLAQKDNLEEEEYIDFSFGLSLLNMSGMKSKYFEGVTINNLILVRE